MAAGVAAVLGVMIGPPEDMTMAITMPRSWGRTLVGVAISMQDHKKERVLICVAAQKTRRAKCFSLQTA